MTREEWLDAFDELYVELGREPTDEEVREYLAEQSNRVFDLDDIDDLDELDPYADYEEPDYDEEDY